MTQPMMLAALDYAEQGIPIFPCHWPVASTGGSWPCSCGQANCSRPGKHPLTRRGHKDATARADIVETWLRRWPDANIAIPTGVKFDVLDIDGSAGEESLHQFAREHGFSPDGPIVRTGSGWHCLFSPTGSGSRVGLLDHVDYRGAGGYVIVPPSLHASGCRYHWLRPSTSIACPRHRARSASCLPARSQRDRWWLCPSSERDSRTGSAP